MKYISTRSGAPDLEFEDVLLTGLSRDGGLYVPKTWPNFSIHNFVNREGQSISMYGTVKNSMQQYERVTDRNARCYIGFPVNQLFHISASRLGNVSVWG